MNYARKRAWIDALLSGKYTQGTGTFKKIETAWDNEANDYHSVTQHCCLGVLCEVANIGAHVEAHRISLPTSGNASAFDEDEALAIGLPADVQTALITFNDEQQRDFSFIAGYIEAMVPADFPTGMDEL